MNALMNKIFSVNNYNYLWKQVSPGIKLRPQTWLSSTGIRNSILTQSFNPFY